MVLTYLLQLSLLLQLIHLRSVHSAEKTAQDYHADKTGFPINNLTQTKQLNYRCILLADFNYVNELQIKI